MRLEAGKGALNSLLQTTLASILRLAGCRYKDKRKEEKRRRRDRWLGGGGKGRGGDGMIAGVGASRGRKR